MIGKYPTASVCSVCSEVFFASELEKSFDITGSVSKRASEWRTNDGLAKCCSLMIFLDMVLLEYHSLCFFASHHVGLYALG
ncbi:hypothetical protein VNO78_08486 [Psophocarpus tetragonolobus]|uniref:Uncharacterized protein n=1 Tax=Psophocarpus tetragonolobus TaxID=3891 RepID=A0AAN9XSN4_PSOTE